MQGYYKISRHYKWALNQVFMKHGFESAIITEEDLNIGVDFFEYFLAMHSILAEDSDSLFCVSAWNDNGKRNLISVDKSGEHLSARLGSARHASPSLTLTFARGLWQNSCTGATSSRAWAG